MNELKPCPFCGGDAAISGNGMYVYCKDCGCKSPYVTTGPRFVIAAWNRRAQPEPAASADPSRDAYEGCREDLLDWKRRALKAEETCRQLTRALGDEVNGPTLMGEPVLPAAAPADAAPSVAPEPPTREALAEIVRLHLTSTYHCTRVWEAWHVGTMTEDDFEPASESDMAEEIADAILAAYPPQAHSVAPEPPDVLCWACGIAINTSQPLPVAPEPVAWTLQSELDAAQTTCSAHLWFTNPRNSAWTALFTREQIAAHPPRAPLTDAEIAAIVLRTVYEGDASTPHRDAWAAEIGVPFARAIEAAHGIGGKWMKINQLILLILDWPCDQFDKFRDWLEKGAAK